MKYFLLALVCFIGIAKASAQTATRMYSGVNVEITKAKKPKSIFTKVEITTPFPGGDSSWVKNLEHQLDQSIRLKKRVKAGKYIVAVRFLVEKDGSLTDAVCIKDPGLGMCQQVTDVIRKSRKGPKWSPGQVSPYRTSSTILVNE